MTNTVTAAMDKGGGASMIGGALLWITDKLEIINVNDVLTGVSLIVGIVWVCFKIRNETLTHKINKRKYDETNKLD